MYGLKLIIPAATSDATLPILYDDAVMSNGSLFLMDLSKTNGDSGTSVTNGGKVNNIAYKTAIPLVGGDINTLKGNVTLSNVTAANAIVEVTAKKGINAVISQTNSLTDLGWFLELPDLVKTYILNNWVNGRFYVSVWHDTTRLPTTTTSAFMLLSKDFQVTGNYKTIFGVTTTFVAAQSGGQSTPSNTLGKQLRSVGTGNSVGATPANLSQFFASLKVGAGKSFGSFEAGKAASMVMYRFYVEDLLVSGRTYAQVQAIDKAAYDVAFAVGGKFYADTFTPATALP